MLTVVTGPPCSGKSTYAWENAKPGDVVVDFDRIAQALGSGDPHDHGDAVRWVAIAARRAAINRAIIEHHNGATVWIVHTRIPQADMDRYVKAGAEIVTLKVDSEELHRRADAERPGLWHKLIDDWTPVAPPKPKVRRPSVPSRSRLDANQRRGREGRPWKRRRKAVLEASDVCWICGHGAADSVDHLEALSRGGDPLELDNLAPAHHQPCPVCRRRCNASRGVASARGTVDTPAPIQSPGW